MSKYTIGIDFGTLSCRALLVRTEDGMEIAASVMEYPHAVIDKELPATGEKLPQNWALEDPHDYLYSLESVIPDVIRQANIDKNDVIGICVDCTCCTLLPVDENGTPLCFTERFRSEKNAYIKLWKHHSAQPYADRMNDIAAKRKDDFLRPFGGKISSEWVFPKMWQTLDEAPEVYAAAKFFIEAGDWINWILTGRMTRGYMYAAFKAEYLLGKGYPPIEFLTECDPRLYDAVDKISGPIVNAGERAGTVCRSAAERFGLAEGTAVSGAVSDAHVGAAGLGISKPGDLFGIIGTSTCYFAVTDAYYDVPGVCGFVKDGVIPEYYGCEAGLCCVGDHFSWLADNFASAEVEKAARQKGISVLKYLIGLAADKKPGETGLIALDWWNGNRSVLVNGELSGLIAGMTLGTRAEDVLRALIEATAFGTRVIFDTLRSCGVAIDGFSAAGGIARKDPFTMQLYSDVLHIPVKVFASSQIPALGCAVYASVAAGSAAGGYDTFREACKVMKSPVDRVYYPDTEAGKIYDRLYAEYVRLHDLFGRGGNDVMMRLRKIADDARNN